MAGGGGDDGEEIRSDRGLGGLPRMQVERRGRAPAQTDFPLGRAGAEPGRGACPGPWPRPLQGLPGSPAPQKRRPVGGSVPSGGGACLAGPRPPRASSQSRAGPRGGAQPQRRVGAERRQNRLRRSRPGSRLTKRDRLRGAGPRACPRGRAPPPGPRPLPRPAPRGSAPSTKRGVRSGGRGVAEGVAQA